MSGCLERQDGEAPGGGGGSPASVAAGLVLVEFYFNQVAPAAIADGPLVVPSSIGDVPFEAVNSLNAATWEFDGNGLHFVQPAGVAGTLTTVTQTSPFIYCLLSDIPQWLYGPQLLLRMYVSQYVPGPTTVNDGVCSGLWRLANDPIAGSPGPNGLYYGFRRSNTAGVDKVIFNRQNNAAGTGLPDADLEGLYDVAAMTVSQNGLATTGFGNYAAGVWSQGNQHQVGTATGVGFSESTRMLFGGQWAASGAPTLEWTIERAQLVRL